MDRWANENWLSIVSAFNKRARRDEIPKTMPPILTDSLTQKFPYLFYKGFPCPQPQPTPTNAIANA